MNGKMMIKNLMGWIRCTANRVPYRKGVYVGRHVHFVNGHTIDLGEGVQIRPDTDLFAGDIFQIGAGSDIGTRNRIVGNVVIGKNVLFGPDNYIASFDHCYSDLKIPVMHQGTYTPNKNGHHELKIGDGSWIGTHVAIIGAVHIGKHCVIGANAVVNRDIPDYCVAVGNPAKIVKKYDSKLESWVKV